MVALDGGGVARAGFDDVGVDRALNKVAHFSDLFRLILKDADEFLADDLALLFGLCYAREFSKEAVFGVDADQVHIKGMAEDLFDGIRLALAEQSVIDEHADEVIADSFVEQYRGDGAVDAAGEGAEYLFADELFAVFGDLVLDEAVHLPVAGAAADVVEEVMEDLRAVLGMGDLGMELDGVDAAAFVAHRGGGALSCARGCGEALGRDRDIVAVAHPADAFAGNVVKEDVVINGQLDLAVLAAVLGACDRAARHVGDQLTAVADTQQRDAQIEDRGVVVGRRRIVDAVGAAGEDDAGVARRLDLGDGDLVIGLDLGVDMVLAYAARNQLVVLAAEIEYEDFLHIITPS